MKNKDTKPTVFNQYFYHPDLSQPTIKLSAEESEHCCRALRHREGDEVFLTDGHGREARAIVMVADPKACVLEIKEVKEEVGTRKLHLHIAIAPTKNADRIEWFVEKSVEIGVEAITFLICDHSERPRVNLDRLRRVAIAALKQCQTTWLPTMEVLTFNEFIEKQRPWVANRYIAWCDDKNTRQFAAEPFTAKEVVLLIGPEGDFSEREIASAREAGYTEVKLGNRRLRTETAGLYGCLVVATHELFWQ
ncbi:MAG: 16S rRNA (uracil(1498)-N(3))-methyltransferase [Bacteroidales bacterium]|nr:16S rRNA (uracil(1498)-N(3))-methyltransferase [Bacteroidales bacterium]